MSKRVLLTGATGFVGRHIHPQLIEAGFDVLGGTRHPDQARAKHPDREYVTLDLGDRASLEAALARVDAAVYLVHSMAEGADYLEIESRAAERFASAAEASELERIVYLGGIRPRGALSHHLESRLLTGEILRAGKVPVVELRATMILGGGSESFRIVRDLAARLPAMLLPKWLESESEPVAIRDIGAAITHALKMPLERSAVFDAPGPERLSGREIIERTARILGHRPRTMNVPVVTPRLSTWWIRLVTRANPRVAGELVEGLRSNIVSDGRRIWDEMPDYRRTSFEQAVWNALAEEERSLTKPARLMERALGALSPRAFPRRRRAPA